MGSTSFWLNHICVATVIFRCHKYSVDSAFEDVAFFHVQKLCSFGSHSGLVKLSDCLDFILNVTQSTCGNICWFWPVTFIVLLHGNLQM